MAEFHISPREDYNTLARLGKSSVFCYSSKRLKELYPDKSCRIVGDLPLKKPSSKQDGNGKAEKTPSVGEVFLNGLALDVLPAKHANPVLYKTVGYVMVGENEFLRLVSSRVPFLLVLLSLVLAFGIALGAILYFGGSTVATPDHPMPDRDPDSLPVEGGEGDQFVSEEGGGKVRMIYTTIANAKLSKDEIEIYFVNPAVSNHCVVLELYVVYKGERYLIGSSGRIDPDYGLKKLRLDRSEIELAPTTGGYVYEGVYVVRFYDIETGERAIANTEIADIIVTASNAN